MDTKIIGHDDERGCGKISIQCKESPSDDKVELIKRHMEFITREDTQNYTLSGIIKFSSIGQNSDMQYNRSIL